ncbi:hypothetical protein LINPERHAP2_LOCUS14869 [Linum perenne]
MELSLLLLSLLFLSVSSHEKLVVLPGQFVDPKVLNAEKHLRPHEKFGDPFGYPSDYKEKKPPNDFGTSGLTSLETQKFVGDVISPAAALEVEAALSVADEYKDKFKLFTNNSGVSAMTQSCCLNVTMCLCTMPPFGGSLISCCLMESVVS